MTATVTQPSDTEPHEWSQALESAVGVWIDLLDGPDELEARAVWLRTTEAQDCESDIIGQPRTILI
jgi:hypothetical protein